MFRTRARVMSLNAPCGPEFGFLSVGSKSKGTGYGKVTNRLTAKAQNALTPLSDSGGIELLAGKFKRCWLRSIGRNLPGLGSEREVNARRKPEGYVGQLVSRVQVHTKENTCFKIL